MFSSEISVVQSPILIIRFPIADRIQYFIKIEQYICTVVKRKDIYGE